MSNGETKQTSIDAIYQQVSGINIGEQLEEWDARGKGYYGEFLLFSEIYKYIPGYFKILMNLQIPSENGKTTEIDLLLIHETGLYVFEAKHYKSKIYGEIEAPQWTQFFITEKNKRFPNPVFQNRWHIEQLRKLVPIIPIHSFIVFTSSECELKVTGEAPNTILCKKNVMRENFEIVARKAASKLSVKEIDDIFTSLMIYSPLQDAVVSHEDHQEVNFYQFIEMLSNIHSVRKQELEQKYTVKEQELKQKYIAQENASKKKIKKSKRRTIGACAAIVLLSLILTGNAVSRADAKVSEYQNDADTSRAELQQFMKKWKIITDFEIDGGKLKADYVTVDYAELKPSEDFGEVVYLSFSITHNGEDFYVLIDKSSMFTIVLNDGRVIETPCYKSPYYSYSLGYSASQKNLEAQKVEFTGFSVEDVAFIKMTSLQIKRIQYVYGEKPLLTDYEIVLYTAK